MKFTTFSLKKNPEKNKQKKVFQDLSENAVTVITTTDEY